MRFKRALHALFGIIVLTLIASCAFLSSSGPQEEETSRQLLSVVASRSDQSTALAGEGRLASGASHNCAILGNGQLKCWGANDGYQLGVGDSNYRGDSPNEMGALLPAVTLPAGLSARAVAAGFSQTCALLSDSTVRCWGSNGNGELGIGSTNTIGDSPGELAAMQAVPLGRPVRAITGLNNSFCAILDNGTVKCWGSNSVGQLGTGFPNNVGDATNPVNPNGGAVALGTGRTAIAIAGGFAHACAILDTGDVKCWGFNSAGQLGVGDMTSRGTQPTDMGDSLKTVPLGAGRTATAIVTGFQHSCATLDDRTVKCWGDNSYGELGVGDTIQRGGTGGYNAVQLVPVAFQAGVTVRSLVAGALHNCAILDTGDVKCWGGNSSGQLGQGDTTDTPYPPFFSLTLGKLRTARALAAGFFHTCASLDDGSIKCWGNNGSGELGIGNSTSHGDTLGSMGDSLPPVYLKEAITAGMFSDISCSISDLNGALKCWGNNAGGQLGSGDTVSRGGLPSDMDSNLATVPIEPVVSVDGSSNFACAVLTDGTYKCWGTGTSGQLGVGNTFNALRPPTGAGGRIESGHNIVQLKAGYLYACAVLDNGNTHCWGDNTSGQLGVGDTVARSSPAPAINFGTDASGAPLGATAIAPGEFGACAVLTDGSVKCWGRNNSHELGLGDTVSRSAPTNAVSLPGRALGISSNNHGSCAVLIDGTVYCWGFNGRGELGQGNTSVYSTPVNVQLSYPAISLTAGQTHTCALSNDGAVRCWGFNDSGQLGYGDTNARGDTDVFEIANLPAVALGTGVMATQIVAGAGHTCALLTDGTRKCWGNNAYGQLGQGDTNPRADGLPAGTPEMGDNLPAIKLATRRAALSVTVGNAHACAILENGPVKCWGDNTNGQLGLGDTTVRGTTATSLGSNLPPVALGTGRSARQISANGDHTCALLDNGNVKCWGLNSSGELGIGDTVSRGTATGQMNDALPIVQMPSGLPAVSVSAGVNHSCALLTNGQVECWGNNNYGQCGQPIALKIGDQPGELGSAISPINLSSTRRVRSISASNQYTCALLDNGRIKCWGLNYEGNLGDGDSEPRGQNPDRMGDMLPYVDLGRDISQVPLQAVNVDPSCAIMGDASLKCWGENDFGQLGRSDTTQLITLGDFTPVAFSSPYSIISVWSGSDHRCAILHTGNLKCWGDNANGQLGIPGGNEGVAQGQMATLQDVNLNVGGTHTPVQGSAHSLETCVVLEDGEIKCWGSNLKGSAPAGQLGLGTTVASVTAPGASVAIGDTAVCAGGGCNTDGNCAAGTVVPNDNNPCTLDSCSAATGVVHVPQVGLACNDGNSLTANDVCDVHGACSGTATAVDDGNACTRDYIANGVSVHDPLASGGSCGGTSVCNGAGSCVVASNIPTPPADPAAQAPAVKTMAMPFTSRYSFLYSGSTPVQTGVTVSQIDPNRAAVVRGMATDGLGRPLPSVQVTVLNHGELGQTLSRVDGAFDMVVNGGGPLTLVYNRTGFFPVHRKIKPRWHDIKQIEPVALTPPDAQYDQSGNLATTAIKAGTCAGTCTGALTVVRGRPVVDDAGTRRATVLIPDNVGASGVTGAFTVRATEYTDGKRGGSTAMPGPLQFGIAYTYALELSIDEAPLLNTVTFANPVVVYVDNYRNMPVGNDVPLGYYDRNKAAWIPTANGRTMQITGFSGTSATVTGTVAALSGTELSTLYNVYHTQTPPINLVRFSVTHFTPYDGNYGPLPPDCAHGGPCSDDRAAQAQKPQDPNHNTACGSIIDCQSESVGESVPIGGTPYTLNYQSRRLPGYTAERDAVVTFSACTGSETHSQRSNSCAMDGTFACTWSSCKNTVDLQLSTTDPYGRPRMGIQDVPVFTAEIYPLSYNPAGGFADLPNNASFTKPSLPCQPTYNPMEPPWLQDCVFSVLRWITARGYFYDARTSGLGGWTVDAHHDFDPSSGVLELGNGERRFVKSFDSRIVKKIKNPITPIGNFDGACTTSSAGAYCFTPSFALATGPDGSIYFVTRAGYLYKLSQDRNTLTKLTPHQFGPEVHGLAVSPEGNLYLAENSAPNPPAVWLIVPNGTNATLTALTFTNASGQTIKDANGTPFPQRPEDVAVADDGTLYITDNILNAVLRRDPTGVMSLYAGLARPTVSNTGGPGAFVRDIDLVGPRSVAVAPDGSLYVLAKAYQGGTGTGVNLYPSIRHITADGRINTVVDGSTATGGVSDDWGSMDIDSTGRVYYSTGDTVRYLDTDGTLHIALGIPGTSVSSNGDSDIPSTSTTTTGNSRVAVLPDDTLVASFDDEIRRIAPFDTTGQNDCIYSVPSEDGHQFYCFDVNGRHSRTVDADTGVPIVQFTYNSDSTISKITDAVGNATTINWAGGKPVSIVGPFNQTTQLALDTNGYLKTVTNADGATSEAMTYANGGLLQTYTDARGFPNTYVYTTSGTLHHEVLANGGTQAISETLTSTTPGLVDQTITFKSALAVSSGKNPTTYKSSAGLVTAPQLNSRPAGFPLWNSAKLDGAVKVTTTPDGVKTRITRTSDGQVFTEYQDGTVTASVNTTPDPRFQSSASYSEMLVTQINQTALSTQSLPITYQQTENRTTVPGGHTQSFSVAGLPPQSVQYTDAVPGVSLATRTSASPVGRVAAITTDSLDRPTALTQRHVGGALFTSNPQYASNPTAAPSKGRMTRLQIGDSTSGLRTGRDVAYYPIDTTAKSGLVQKVAAGTLAADGTIAPGGTSYTATPDAFGRPLSQAFGTDQPTITSWFGNSDLATVTLPATGSPLHKFDYLPLTKKYTPPTATGSSGSQTTAFNIEGQLSTTTRQNGDVATYGYDPVSGQLNTISFPTGQTKLTYWAAPSCGSSDFCVCTTTTCGAGSSPGRVHLLDQCQSAISGTACANTVETAVSYTGPLVAEVKTLDSNEAHFLQTTVDWTYNARLLRDSEVMAVPTTPNYSKRSSFAYDADGLITCVEQNATTCDTTGANADAEKLTYDATSGLLTGTKLGSTTDTYTYNAFNELASYTAFTINGTTSTQIYQVVYDDGTKQTATSRDGAGRVQQKKETRNGGVPKTTNYTYHDDGRLKSVIDPGSGIGPTYTYDADGNRAISGITYDAQDRLLPSSSYTFTADGDLQTHTTGSTSTTYKYDMLGRLINATFKSGAITTKTIDYLLDGYGHRIGKKSGTTTSGPLAQQWIYGKENQLLGQIDFDATTHNPSTLKRFFYGSKLTVPDFMELVTLSTGASKLYRIVSDQLGSAVMVVNTQSPFDVIMNANYDQWGIPSWTAGDGTQIPFGFAGGLYDAETSLVRFGARDYDPATGRWTSRDPVLFGGRQPNVYVYVNNDPVNRTDPTGLWYFDANFTFVTPGWFGGTAGVFITPDGVYPYGGSAVGTPGPSFSGTFSVDSISPGLWSTQLAGGDGGAGFAKGMDRTGAQFGEFGLSTPGVALTTYYTSSRSLSKLLADSNDLGLSYIPIGCGM